MKRADWHLRANIFVLLYLLAALATGIGSALAPEPHVSWLTLHLLLLGAITNGILTWSEHFVAALLWSRSQGRSRNMRIVLTLNVGILGVMAGVEMELSWLLLIAALLVAGIISYYLWGVSQSIKETLNKRYVGLIRYYQFAGFAILIGITLGVIDTFISEDSNWQPRIALAHLHVNLMGWVGLTIIGTLVTFWPTILRTPMHAKAVQYGEAGLKYLVSGTLVVALGTALDARPFVVLGDITYLVGTFIALLPAVIVIKQRVPDRASSWMVATGVVGFAILTFLDLAIALRSDSAEQFLESIEDHALVFFVVWLLPIFLGSLTYLLPMALGRGPKINRELENIINFGWQGRVFLFPISSFLLLFTQFHVVGYMVAGSALGFFLVLAFLTLARAKRYKTATAI